ncbi:YlxR family protein [Paenarthrobacter sp. PH39-S1]|uniref:YlxR family protein n=1 Tax=Paenarthrobacter sp. PH39-S1 TaxID=3046204 RepID=UPI0024B8A996|nr:YlxR family protein [Paenarthrobacter sp. PH39-S1]MDJ0357270.1 YlxR family protein [Paenarthrobacter sp. PH39-S1]
MGCRRRDAQSRLLRMVRGMTADGVISAVADPHHRLSGRGAWLHPTRECLELALKRRAIGRALPGVADNSSVLSHIAGLTGG